MLPLSSRGIKAYGFPQSNQRFILRLKSQTSDLVTSQKNEQDCIIMRGLEGVKADTYLLPMEFEKERHKLDAKSRLIFIPEDLAYLGDGDIVAVDPQKQILNVIYRRASLHNSLLVTERCNHYCLMCSQPPKTRDDSVIYAELMRAVPLMNQDTLEIGITGGEPTLDWQQFLALVKSLRTNLPKTEIHILSNGRTFQKKKLTIEFAKIEHKKIMLGIPLYADYAALHDYIVQSDNAFDETVRGILNLKAWGVRVEIRIVILKQNHARLFRLAEFIARNLTFVDHVALMGLEITGFARANYDQIWVDPYEYKENLTQAAQYLTSLGLAVSIYNHQLCTIDRSIWHLARRSISDWKNSYLPLCDRCSVREKCAGFFSTSGNKLSKFIHVV